MPNKDNHLLVAELKSAYGIKGWLWLYSYTEPKETLFSYSPLLFEKDGKLQEVVVDNWRSQGKGLVVKLADVEDRNHAEQLSGTKIWLNKDDLPKLNENEVYWDDLYGLIVTNQQQANLGTVKEVFETNAHPILKVVPTANSVDDIERLIPFHETTVLSVDVEAQTIVVDWMVDY